MTHKYYSVDLLWYTLLGEKKKEKLKHYSYGYFEEVGKNDQEEQIEKVEKWFIILKYIYPGSLPIRTFCIAT